MEIFCTGGMGEFSWRRKEGNGLAWVVRDFIGRGEGREA